MAFDGIVLFWLVEFILDKYVYKDNSNIMSGSKLCCLDYVKYLYIHQIEYWSYYFGTIEKE